MLAHYGRGKIKWAIIVFSSTVNVHLTGIVYKWRFNLFHQMTRTNKSIFEKSGTK